MRKYLVGMSFPAALQHAHKPHFQADFFHSWQTCFRTQWQIKLIHIWTRFLIYFEFT